MEDVRHTENFAARINMELNLSGRRALVTGGSRGIGFAVASEFASEGCDVVLVARVEDNLASAANRLADVHRVNIKTVAADLSSHEDIVRVVEAVGDVDILVNNAG